VLYVIPTGQNPSGATLPEERRREIYGIAQQHNFIILEDDPYFHLQLDKQQVPTYLPIYLLQLALSSPLSRSRSRSRWLCLGCWRRRLTMIGGGGVNRAGR
jgi:DNA-binding transcriptional MocR family regulator